MVDFSHIKGPVYEKILKEGHIKEEECKSIISRKYS